MYINDSILQNKEIITLRLRELYASYGYTPYRMSKFEEYDLYAGNKDFLVSDNVITFTDTNGKLLALKPDVTLSIIKNSTDNPEETARIFYNENVYRVSKGSGTFKEIMQSGVECFGKVGPEEIKEALLLACKSLKTITDDFVITVSDLDLIDDMLAQMNIDQSERPLIYKLIGEKNLHELDQILTDLNADSKAKEQLEKLISLSGALDEAEEMYVDLKGSSILQSLLKTLADDPLSKNIRVDFSVVNDINYYNGIVFKGFVNGIPSPVLSGGQYDRLMGKLRRRSKAIGFAVYSDLFDRNEEKTADDEEYLNIALPKGRLGEKVYAVLAEAGFDCPAILEPNRKLIFENPEKKIRYFWVKPSDVAIYVERGAADIGIVGKDILLEYEPDIYELMDLKLGNCKMAVAAPKGFRDDPSSTLIVATKFSNIARQYYQSKGRDIDIIHLNGSIEIAPILGLSDVIVDIVETGTTLRENDLEVMENIIPISARLTANKASYGFRKKQIENVVNGVSAVLEKK